MMSLVTSEELGNDVTGSEALIERHQVWKIVQFFRPTRVKSFDRINHFKTEKRT